MLPVGGDFFEGGVAAAILVSVGMIRIDLVNARHA
jgi:hypothetical protein